MAKDFLSRMDADIRPPVNSAAAASAAGKDGVFRIALTAASVRAIIPAGWKGNDVDFSCDGGTGYYVAFGGSSVALVAPSTTVSTIAAEAITYITGTGKKVEAGGRLVWRVPNDAAVTHFCWFGASAAGYIEAYCSTGNGEAPAP